MTEMQPLSFSSKGNTQSPEGVNDNMPLGIPSRQRSCGAVSTPTACVNKAIHHIQDLEVKMEESFQQYDHLYKLDKIPRDSDTESVEETKDIWLSVSSELKAEQSLYWKDIQPLKQKTTTVLAEVIELVTRLEKERKEAEEALEFEKRRRKKLYLNADYLSLWRMQQLPLAVQKEWENCSQEVIELQLHFEYKNQQLQDAVNQLMKIDIANAKIQENIDYMKKYSPLVGEKLSYEGGSMGKIQDIYSQTKAGYDIVHEKLEKVRGEHQEMIEDCERERFSMSQKIMAAESLLNHLMNELKETDILYTDLCIKIKEKEAAILQNRNRLKELVKQDTELKSGLKSWKDKVERLTKKIITQDNENKDLLNEYSETQKNMMNSKSSRKSDLQKLKDKLQDHLQQISDLQNENKYLYNENDGFIQKFRDSSRRKVGYLSEIQVLEKNIRRLEGHLKKVGKELYGVELTYEETKAKLEELEQSIIKEQARFKNLQDNVQKQIRDEISAWKLTQKRVKALQKEIEKTGKENKKVQEKFLKKLAQIVQRVADQQALLAKNTEMQKANIKKIAILNQKIEELDEKEKKRNQELTDRKNYLQKQLNDVQEKYLDISSQLDKANADIEKFQNQLAKLNTLSKGTQKQMDNIEEYIAELREKYAKIKAKEQNAQTLVDFLCARLDYVEKKVKTDNRVFEELLWNRQKHLKDKKLSRLQSKMHGVLVECFKLRGLYSQAGLAKFQAASHENVQKILAVQGRLSKTIQHTTTFLKSLTDGSST
ncbi:coiled-coil domain-containing protein 178 isoform X2 [Hemicordylus capensis]|uniref:coiled-coil domain-containing protein 178 isoform X2 n=1 Tax=Hemicordylus capensis TaxID=884348 RepID=UPI002302E1DB|nr:coiled-coil domain-containing protein 178 isoform X2 [Hemicordylus capensis]